MKDLLGTLTSSWLLGGTTGQHKQLTEFLAAEVDKWCASMKRAFHGEYLKEVKKKRGDHGRVAFLRLMDLTLFDVVKRAIVADGTEKAIGMLCHVRPFLPLLHKCTTALSGVVVPADRPWTPTGLYT